MPKHLRTTLITSLIIVCLLIIWEVLARYGVIKKAYTSYPSAIINDLILFYKSGQLIPNLLATTYEAASGLFFGTIVGVLVAIIAGNFRAIGDILEPILIVLNSIPQIALAPVYILWLGIGFASKIFMASLLVFFLVFFSTYSGVRNCEKNLKESAELLGAGEFTILFKITLPTIVPWIIAGIKASIGAALIGAIVGEYLGATKGLGWTISFATSYFDMNRVMSCLVLLLFLGYLCNKLLALLESRLTQYQNR